MTDRPSLLPPSDGSFLGAPTPSGLTPNARSEAEAALTHNSSAQTDSAAPQPNPLERDDEALKAYRRPGPVRTSSANYENALKRAQQASTSSNISVDSDTPPNITGGTVASPTSSSTPFPPPGQGVVPLNYGAVGASSGDSIKKTRSRGLSLSGLAQQQGWNEQDYKRVYNSDLLNVSKDDPGYSSGTEHRQHGP